MQTGVCGQGNLIWQSGRNNSISDTTLFLLEEDPKQKSRRKIMLKKNKEKKGNPIHDVVSGNDELWRVVGKDEKKDVKGGYLVARPLDLLAKVVGLKHFKRLNSALYLIYIYNIHIYIDCTSARFYVAY